jgi:hypothetical protein
VRNYSRLPQSTRDKLAETKVGPAPPSLADTVAGIPRAAAQARAEATPDQAAR